MNVGVIGAQVMTSRHYVYGVKTFFYVLSNFYNLYNFKTAQLWVSRTALIFYRTHSLGQFKMSVRVIGAEVMTSPIYVLWFIRSVRTKKWEVNLKRLILMILVPTTQYMKFISCKSHAPLFLRAHHRARSCGDHRYRAWIPFLTCTEQRLNFPEKRCRLRKRPKSGIGKI